MKRPLMSAPLPFATPTAARSKAVRRQPTGVSQPASSKPAHAEQKPAAPVRRKKQVAKAATPNQPRFPAKSKVRKSSTSRHQRRQRIIEALEQRQVFAAPTLTTIVDQNLHSGAPIQVALNGTDTDANEVLTFSIEDDPNNPNPQNNNPNIIAEVRSSTNRTLVLNIDYRDATPTEAQNGIANNAADGQLVFQLFDDLTPEITNRIVTLVNQGFYDGILFHRVINNFVIQAGDPNTKAQETPSTQYGTGGSGVTFDDVFNPDLQHTVSGLLSMAKTSDDTNDSQFFVTEGSYSSNLRNLDFNHSIFGMLTKGEDVRAAISDTATGAGDRPVREVRIITAEIVQDTRNQVLSIKAADGYTGSGSITVKVDDGNGGVDYKTFNVTVTADNVDNDPYLINPPPQIDATMNGAPVNYQIQANNIDGGSTTYNAYLANSADSSKVTLTINKSTGLLTVTPINNFVGVVNIVIMTSPLTVAQHEDIEQQVADYNNNPANTTKITLQQGYDFFATNNGYKFDTQSVPVVVSPTTPITIDLVAASDTGSSNSDNITSKNNNGSSSALTFLVSGVTPGAIVQLFDGATLIGQATAAGTTVQITTNGTTVLSDTTHSITAHQQFVINAGNQHRNADLDSQLDATMNVTIDTTAPVFNAIDPQDPLLSINEGSVFSYQVAANDSNGPLVYALVSGPSGATVNPSTGVVSYTTLETDGGSTKNFTVRATDTAGVSSTVSFNLTVNDINNFNPVFAPIGQQNVTVDHELVVSINATDADLPAQTLSYELQNNPAGATIDANGVIRWTPDNSFAGTTQTFTFVVKDNAGGSTSASFDVYVNQAPVLTVQTSHTVDELQTLTFTASATDADLPAQTLVYGLSNAPAGMTINASTGVISWKPTEAQGPAIYTFQVVVTDSSNGSDSETVSITVNEVNQLPILGALNTLTAFPGETLTAQIPGSDADLPLQGLTYSLDTAPAGISINPTTGVLTWALPNGTAEGTFAVTVRLTDAIGDSVTRDYLIQVSPFNIGNAFGLTSQWTSTSVAAPRDSRPIQITSVTQTAVTALIDGQVAPVSALGSNSGNSVTSLLGGLNRLQATNGAEVVEALKPIVEGGATGAINESGENKTDSKPATNSGKNPFDSSSAPANNPAAPAGIIPTVTTPAEFDKQSRWQKRLDWREHLRSAALVELAAAENFDLNWVSRAPQAPVLAAMPEPVAAPVAEVAAEAKPEPQPKTEPASEAEPLAASVGALAVAGLALRPRKATPQITIPVVSDEVRRKRGPRRTWY